MKLSRVKPTMKLSKVKLTMKLFKVNLTMKLFTVNLTIKLFKVKFIFIMKFLVQNQYILHKGRLLLLNVHKQKKKSNKDL